MLPKNERSLAFNAGCNARIAGIPFREVPYDEEDPRYYWWLSGWQDVHQFWGRLARWPIRILPPAEGMKKPWTLRQAKYRMSVLKPLR